MDLIFIHCLHNKLPQWSYLHLDDMSLHFSGRFVWLKQMGKYRCDPNLGYRERLQACLSSTGEVARHLNGVGGAAEVWVDPVSAWEGVAAEEENSS